MPENVTPVEALLLIDLQVGSLAAVPDAKRLVDRTAVLLAAARASGAAVVHVQNDGAAGMSDEPGTPGWELHLPVDTGEAVIRKPRDNAFDSTDLADLLTARGVRSVALCGLMSDGHSLTRSSWSTPPDPSPSPSHLAEAVLRVG
jgi:streptothricin hydrolase